MSLEHLCTGIISIVPFNYLLFVWLSFQNLLLVNLEWSLREPLTTGMHYTLWSEFFWPNLVAIEHLVANWPLVDPGWHLYGSFDQIWEPYGISKQIDLWLTQDDTCVSFVPWESMYYALDRVGSNRAFLGRSIDLWMTFEIRFAQFSFITSQHYEIRNQKDRQTDPVFFLFFSVYRWVKNNRNHWMVAIFKNKTNLEQTMSISNLSRSWIYLYNGERMGMTNKGAPEICLFQSNGIKTFLSNCGMHRQTCRSTNQQCTTLDNLRFCNANGQRVWCDDETQKLPIVFELRLREHNV